MNYLGDLMLSLAFCLTCGFTHVLPYFYIGQRKSDNEQDKTSADQARFSRSYSPASLSACALLFFPSRAVASVHEHPVASPRRAR